MPHSYSLFFVEKRKNDDQGSFSGSMESVHKVRGKLLENGTLLIKKRDGFVFAFFNPIPNQSNDQKMTSINKVFSVSHDPFELI